MIKNVSIKSFRNYSNVDVEIGGKINILVGENGQGKTNFLETIYLMSFLKSFRKAPDKELIPHNNDYYYVKGQFENEEVNQIEIGYNKTSKNVKINGSKLNTLVEGIGKINVVLFSDKDIELLYSSPSLRRQFLDMTLSVVDNEYLNALLNYKNVLKTRNAAIRQYWEQNRNRDKELIKIWDKQFISSGSVLIKKRINFINEIEDFCREIFPVFTNDNLDMHLKYKTGIDYSDDIDEIKEKFKVKLDNELDNDLKYGYSTTGPHRDDIKILDNKNLLKKFASKGQARAACLILKLTQMKYFEKHKNRKAILLLDDILLDLDKKNKNNFLNILGEDRQCFFTSTSLDEFKNIDGVVYKVKNGNINVD